MDELVVFGTHDQHGKRQFRQARHQVGAVYGGDELRQQHVLAQVQAHLPDQARDGDIVQVGRVQQLAQALARDARVGVALQHGHDALARGNFLRQQALGGIGDQSQGLHALRVRQRVFERQVGAQRKADQMRLRGAVAGDQFLHLAARAGLVQGNVLQVNVVT